MHKILTATLAAAVTAAGVMATGVAQAGTANTTFAVTATVQSVCAASAVPLAFPNYVPGAGTLTANTTITVKCTKNSPYTVALNIGATTGATMGQRLMASGTNTLQYNLYTTTGLTTVFGDTTAGSATVAGTGAGVATPTTVTVYGQLPDSATNQTAVVGNYTDTITVTVSY
jgi:spore coat protein U-like protein